MILLKHKNEVKKEIRHYLCKCTCGAEFLFTEKECKTEKHIGGNSFIKCPECEKVINITNHYSVINGIISQITIDEYNELSKQQIENE